MSLSNYSALSEGVLLGLFLWYFVKNAARDSWVFVELCVCGVKPSGVPAALLHWAGALSHLVGNLRGSIL